MERGSSRTPALLAEFDALDAATAAVLAAVGGAGRWDGPTRRAAMERMQRHLSQMTAANLTVVAAEQAAGTWALKGDRNLPDFLNRVTRQGRGAGMAAVGQAATLEAMPVVAEALVDGPVTPKHVAEITRATAASPVLAAELATPEAQAELVELARRLDGSHFGTALRQMSASLDPASRQREHDEQRARRSLVITHTPGGTLVKAQLDSVAGHKFAKMIDAFNPRPAADDPRPRDVRQADALLVGVDRLLADTRTTPGATAPVQAVITLREETWTALRAARDIANADQADNGAAAAAGSVADVVARLRGVPAVLDESGQAWPASEVARVLCDCALTRVVLDATGQPLNLGRRERLFSKAQWLALYASGVTTCAVDGCSMPLAYSELHHITWWENGGLTDLSNLAPECSFHHHDIHKNAITVTRRPDGSYEHRHPDGRIYGGTPPDNQDDSTHTGSPPGEQPLCCTA